MSNTQYDNSNRFTLFRNKDRKTDSHPEFSGTLDVNGVEYWLSAWVKTSGKTGDKFFSGSIKPKDTARTEPRRQPPPPIDIDDAIPF
jgi:hypothetical protein